MKFRIPNDSCQKGKLYQLTPQQHKFQTSTPVSLSGNLCSPNFPLSNTINIPKTYNKHSCTLGHPQPSELINKKFFSLKNSDSLVTERYQSLFLSNNTYQHLYKNSVPPPQFETFFQHSKHYTHWAGQHPYFHKHTGDFPERQTECASFPPKRGSPPQLSHILHKFVTLSKPISSCAYSLWHYPSDYVLVKWPQLDHVTFCPPLKVVESGSCQKSNHHTINNASSEVPHYSLWHGSPFGSVPILSPIPLPPSFQSIKYNSLPVNISPTQTPNIVHFTLSDEQRHVECFNSASTSMSSSIGVVGPVQTPPKNTLDMTIHPSSGQKPCHGLLSPSYPHSKQLFCPEALNVSGIHPKPSNPNTPKTNDHEPKHPLTTPILNHKLRNTLWGIAGNISRSALPFPLTRQQIFLRLRQLVIIFLQRRNALNIQITLHAFLKLLLQLHTISWLILLLIKYYLHETTPSSVTPDIAARGLGLRGHFSIPPHIWHTYVPNSLLNHLRTYIPPPPFEPRKTKSLTKILLSSLVRDKFLIPSPKHSTAPPSNLSVFLRPKSSEKAAFIADLRGLNQLTPTPLPSFHLPSLSDIAEIIRKFPPSTLFATTLDLTNFFWSLQLPQEAQHIFRIDNFSFTSPPFGWNLSPIIAQKSLEFLLSSSLENSHFSLLYRSEFWYFVYYDDVFLLATTFSLCNDITQFFVSVLQQNSLIISKKSCLNPSQQIKWLGKLFLLNKRQITNTHHTLLCTISRSVLASLIPVFDKRIDVILGHLLWSVRPLPGITSILRSWYLHRWHGRRYLPQPSNKMVYSLFDATILSCSPWEATDPIPPPFFTHVICGDAARFADSYYIGLFSPSFGAKLSLCPPYVSSQQQAEYFALDYATNLAVRLHWNSLTYIGDNMGVCYIATNLRPQLSSPVLCTITRRILNRLLWSKLNTHILWCASQNQPADPISRIPFSRDHHQAVTTASELWDHLCTSFSVVKYIGILSL